MKKVLFTSIIFFCCFFEVLAQKTGDRIQINKDGKWEPGKLISYGNGMYLVDYDQWYIQDETVTPDRVMFLSPTKHDTANFLVAKIDTIYTFKRDTLTILKAKTDTIYKYNTDVITILKNKIDTVYKYNIADVVTILKNKSDTVYKYKLDTVTILTKGRTDTIYKGRIDTVYSTKPTTVTVEAPSTSLYTKSEKVQVISGSKWMPASILEVVNNMYKVRYVGLPAAFDEVVSADRIRSNKIIGRKVKVSWTGNWYDATITQVNEKAKKYFIHYDGWSTTSDEWVGVERIKF
jgi:hypothetical protein